MTDMLDRDVEGPIAWTGDTLAADAGLIHLSNRCLAELEAAARMLRENPLPVVALRAGDFELSACRETMARVRSELDEGIGFAILDRLNVADFGREAATALYWLLAGMVARPVAQKWDGRMVYDVRDSGQKPGNGVRPDITNVDQNFHTDNSYNLCPPDYVTLLCLQTAAEGGVSGLVSFPAAYNEMRRRYPELLPRLHRGYWFDRQREHAPDDVKVIRHPLFEFDGERLTARLSRFQVVNGYALAGEPIDAEGAAAIEALESVMNDPLLLHEFSMEPGQIQFVDNRRCGHKRTGFRDHPEEERKRHLIRLWLRHRGRAFYNG
jgi:alpha-ketoglutarate-dependent taurine dioxygenase